MAAPGREPSSRWSLLAWSWGALGPSSSASEGGVLGKGGDQIWMAGLPGQEGAKLGSILDLCPGGRGTECGGDLGLRTAGQQCGLSPCSGSVCWGESSLSLSAEDGSITYGKATLI